MVFKYVSTDLDSRTIINKIPSSPKKTIIHNHFDFPKNSFVNFFLKNSKKIIMFDVQFFHNVMCKNLNYYIIRILSRQIQ